MRILHIIDKLNTGGAEKVFIDITHLLAEKGVAVDALLFDATGDMTPQLDSRLKVHVLNRTNKYAVSKMWELHRICSGYDIVHAHMRHVYQYVRLVQFLFNGGYKLVIHDHYGIDKTIPLSLKYIFRPRYYIGVCTALTEWAKTDVGLNAGNVYLLRNTIIPKAIAGTSGSHTRKAMMVANISRVKNIEFAIRLFKKMDWELDIYGNSRDPVYYNELLQLIGDNNKIRIINNVTDFSGLYNRYSLAIHSSRSESGPLVLLEYLVQGLPFITYKTGEVAEVIYNDLPFLLMDSFDMEKWIVQVDKIMQAESLPVKMKEVFNRYFLPGKYVEECLQIYERISC